MSWTRVGFERAMTHVIDDRLFPLLVDDLVGRGHPIDTSEKWAVIGGNSKPIDEWVFDFGGSCYVDEPRLEIVIDDLAIGFRCVHIEPLIKNIEQLPKRRFASGETYCKVKLWMHATVLLPAQREEVLAKLRALVPIAVARNVEFDQVLAERWGRN